MIFTVLLVSCSKDEPVEEKDIPDPVNGVSEYLLEKSTTGSVHGSATTTYSYDENGVLVSDELEVFPARLGSLTEPYVIKKGNLKLYCDDKKRVVKEEGENYYVLLEYDAQDRIQRRIGVYLPYDRKDTTLYTYYNPGENNFEGASYHTRSSLYTINRDGLPTLFSGHQYENYYYSPTVKLKSWITYPYNYGKIPDTPLVRYNYTTLNGSLRQEGFTHTLDERGLIIKTVHNYLGGVTENTYSYIKR
ncbi:MAG: hypothetical protein LRY55_06355 [Leadbetterella sp.]|nr:hypothetical protein [Leadbetterella sp.]